MSPGDRWDSTAGFEISDEDWYVDKERRIEALAPRCRTDWTTRPDVRRSDPRLGPLRNYFTPSSERCLPSSAARHSRPTVFEVPSASERIGSWTFGGGASSALSFRRSDRSGLTRVDEALLADAIDKGW